MKTETDMTFEQAMERLEQIIRQMESGEESLEASMALFEEGNRLARQCGGMLEQAEQKVTRLISVETGEEAPFDTED